MTTSQQRKGNLWEATVADFLNAERRRNHQGNDLGDIVGIKSTVIECKAHGTYQLQEWKRQLREEMIAAKAELGLVAIKTKGKSSAEDGLWLIDSSCVPYVIALVQYNWYERNKLLS